MVVIECRNDEDETMLEEFPEDTLYKNYLTEHVLTDTDGYLEEKVTGSLRKWHIFIIISSAFLSIVFLICSWVKVRLPRTKSEIDANYKRKQLLKKFREKLIELKAAELDTMDYRAAVERLRQEFKADNESLAQSEAVSIVSLCRESESEEETRV